MERELHPNTGRAMEDIINEHRKNRLPDDIRDALSSLLNEFQYAPDKVINITERIIDADVDMALEDCVSLKIWFGLCGNNFEEKEDKIDEAIKILVGSGVSNSKEKITAQKSKILNTGKYKELVIKKIKYKKLKRDCRTLEEAMDMRMHVSQTKSSNYRVGMTAPNINRTI